MSSSQTFLGMTKDQLKTAALALLFVLAALQSVQLWRADDLIAQGVQTHQAVCVLRGDQQTRERQTKAFLHMSKAKRERRYGVAIGEIPNAVLRQSLTGLQQNVHSLRNLGC